MQPFYLRLAVLLSGRIYQGLLRLFPPAFRQTFASPMAQVFRECCREAVQQQGLKGLIGVWLQTLADLLINVVLEWSATLQRQYSFFWPYLLAPILGWLAGYTYLHAGHMQGLALFLVCVLGAGLLGYLRPQGAVEWAALMGVGVPFVHLSDIITGASPPCSMYLLATFLVIVSALVGAFSGVVLGRFRRRWFLGTV